MELICQKCGKSFQHSRNKAYCDSCIKSSDTETRICMSCGKLFDVIKYDKYHYKKQLYCSSCSNKKQEVKTLICQKCGKEFQVGKYKGTDSFIKRKYCSDECALVVPIKTQICATCGKKFDLVRTDDGHFIPKKYCSRECKLKTQREKLNNIKEERQNKIINTCKEKYGVDFACLLPQCIIANSMAKSKINEKFAKKLKDNNIEYTQEFQLGNFIYDFLIVTNDNNLFIEINPTFTHTCHNTLIYPPTSENYHKMKMVHAKNQGYNCICVWDWDDWNKIVNLTKPKQKLYARKLQLKEVNTEETKQFLNKHHIQGKCKNNKINLGLYSDNELVQIMTFGKPRYNKNYQWELLRLCSHSSYIIVGGAEKLLKHFEKEYNPQSIISYCDVSKFNGNVYSRLGFKLLKENAPSKHWSKNTSHITDNLLRQRGYDQLFNTSYGKGTSNEQLMLENGWLPIYDCGQNTYVKEYNS